jgi:hypothetical protein
MSAPGGVAIYLNSAHRHLSSERPMPANISSGYIRLFKECAVEKNVYLLFICYLKPCVFKGMVLVGLKMI